MGYNGSWYGVVVSTEDFKSLSLSSILSRTIFFYFIHYKKYKKLLANIDASMMNN